MTAAGTATAVKSSVRVISFKPLVRGSLRGFCNVEWGAAGLVFKAVPIFISADGNGWCGLPAAPVIDRAGRHHSIEGKRQYRPLLEWKDRARGDGFSEHVIEAL